MKIFFILLIIPLLSILTNGQLTISKTIRLINTIPNYSNNTFFLLQTQEKLLTFQGIWNSPYSQIQINPEIPLFLNISPQNISFITPNLTLYEDYISLIIYEDLSDKTISIYLKSDDLSNLGYSDLAKWSIISLSKKFPTLTLFSQNSDCYKCSNFFTGNLFHLSNDSNGLPEIPSYINSTIHQFFIYLALDYQSVDFSSFQLEIDENGKYTYFLIDSDIDNKFELIKIIDKDPQKAWVPLVITIFILLAICVIRVVFNHFYGVYKANKLKSLRNLEEIEPLNAGLNQKTTPKKLSTSRVESLDLFRGIALVIMIFVNYGGGNYWFFNHSTWNGLTVADLVFPWFIWIMGASMALSFDKLQKSKLANDFSHLDFIYKIIRRSVMLFLLGMFLNNGFDLGNWRIPGVLQRFAVGYLLIALIVSYIPKLDISRLKPLKDILDYIFQWILVLLVLMAYLLITYTFKVEGCPRGYTGPGGIGDYGQYRDCTGGAALYLDKQIFGPKHIFADPSCKNVYQTGIFDPEGFLGNFTSLFLTFTGYQCGRILINYKEDKEKMIRWVIWGVILAGIGIGLCGASKNEGVIPLNKNIWSVSFVLLLGGLAFLCIAVCYFIVDMKKWWFGWPFIYVGRNSIAIYMFHEIFAGFFPLNFKNDGSHTMMLFSNCLGVGFCLWIAWRMNEEKVFIKI